MLYNGSYVPATLRVRPGDTLRITFRNNLDDRSQPDRSGFVGPICTGTGSGTSSNVHYHGMSVSPRGNSDNVFVHLHPGESFRYEVRIPARGAAGPGALLVSPARARLCRSSDSRRHVGRVGGRRIRRALSRAARHARAFFAHQARADRRRRGGLDQRPDQPLDRDAPRRNAILAHRPYRRFVVHQVQHRRHARSM